MDISKLIKSLGVVVLVLILTACGQSQNKYYEIADDDNSAPVTLLEDETEDTIPEGEAEEEEEEPDEEYEYVNHNNFSAEQLMNDYTSALTAAVNNGKFSMVEKYLLKDSSLYNMQKKLVTNLYSAGTKEYMLGVDIERNGWDTKIKGYIDVYEKAEIVYSSGKSEIKEYNWVYTVEYKNGRYYLSDMREM